jgi:nitroreductase
MPNPIQAQDFITFMRRLRAVRTFRPDPVPEPILTDILAVARWSGSAMNRQPWHIIVITDEKIRLTLGNLEGYVKHVAGAPLAIVLVMEGEGDANAFDEGRLSERIMLAAAAHGVGSCIGWFASNAQTEAKQLLKVPDGYHARTIISVGYPAEEAQHSHSKPGEARKPLSEIVHTNRFD